MIYKAILIPFEVMVQLESKESYRISENRIRDPWPNYFKDEIKTYIPLLPTKITGWTE